LDKIDILFVDRKVCQVHKFLNLSEALLGVYLIFAGSKPSQAFLIDVKAQWINACDGDVDAEVEFKPIKQQGVLDVLATNELFFAFGLGYLRQLVGYYDSSTLAGSCWLKNPQFLGLPAHVVFQIHQFSRKNVSFGYESEMFWTVDFSYFTYVSEHKIFPCDVVGIREVVYFLVPFEALKKWGLDSTYLPVQCPVFLLSFFCVNRFDISEAIVLQSISNYFDIVVLELEVITPVSRKLWSGSHWVFIRPEL